MHSFPRFALAASLATAAFALAPLASAEEPTPAPMKLNASPSADADSAAPGPRTSDLGLKITGISLMASGGVTFLSGVAMLATGLDKGSGVCIFGACSAHGDTALAVTGGIFMGIGAAAAAIGVPVYMKSWKSAKASAEVVVAPSRADVLVRF